MQKEHNMKKTPIITILSCFIISSFAPHFVQPATTNNVVGSLTYHWEGGSNTYAITLPVPSKSFTITFDANPPSKFYIGLYSSSYKRQVSKDITIASPGITTSTQTTKTLSSLIECIYGDWANNASKGIFFEQTQTRPNGGSTGFIQQGAIVPANLSVDRAFNTYKYVVELTSSSLTITLSRLNPNSKNYDEMMKLTTNDLTNLNTTGAPKTFPALAQQTESIMAALQKTTFLGFDRIGFLAGPEGPYTVKNVVLSETTTPAKSIDTTQIAGQQQQRSAGLAPIITIPAPQAATTVAVPQQSNTPQISGLQQQRSAGVAPTLDVSPQNALKKEFTGFTTTTSLATLTTRIGLPEVTDTVLTAALTNLTADQLKTILLIADSGSDKRILSRIRRTAPAPLLANAEPLRIIAQLANDFKGYTTATSLATLTTRIGLPEVTDEVLTSAITSLTADQFKNVLFAGDATADKTTLSRIRRVSPAALLADAEWLKERLVNQYSISATATKQSILSDLNTIIGNINIGDGYNPLFALILNTYNAPPAINNVNRLARVFKLLSGDITVARLNNQINQLLTKFPSRCTAAETAGLKSISNHFGSSCTHDTASCPYVNVR
jgi:hypothetical protein